MSLLEGIGSLGRLSATGPARVTAGSQANGLGRPSPSASRSLPTDGTMLVAAKLRAKLGDKPAVVAVTSLAAGEGVTTAVAVLGQALAATAGDEPVLIVDANLTSPAQHAAFGLTSFPGFSELLSGDAEVGDAVHATAWRKLYVLPAGQVRAHGPGRITPERFGEVLSALGSHFHTILVDAPPLTKSGTMAWLTGHSDGVLMLIAPGRHHRSQVRRAMAELASLGVRVVGTCLAESGASERKDGLAKLAARARAWLVRGR